MKVKELIIRLLDEPMDAEVRLCTNNKEKVKTHNGVYVIKDGELFKSVRVIKRGVIFDINEIEHWNNSVNINFTDWREDNE